MVVTPLSPRDARSLLRIIDRLVDPALFQRIEEFVGLAEDGDKLARRIVSTIYEHRCIKDCDCRWPTDRRTGAIRFCKHVAADQTRPLLPFRCQALVLEFIFPEEYAEPAKATPSLEEQAALTSAAKIDTMLLRHSRGESLRSDDLSRHDAVFMKVAFMGQGRYGNGEDRPEVLVEMKAAVPFAG